MRRPQIYFGVCSAIALAVSGCGADFDAGGPLDSQSEPLSTGLSSDPSYLVPLMSGVTFQPLLSVGDSPAT